MLDPNTDVVPESKILGSTPRGRYRQENLQLMDDSKQNAVVVALRRLGYNVKEEGKGTLVVEVLKGTPAEGHLRPGDAITSVNGVATPLAEIGVDQIHARHPGDTLTLGMTAADGTTRTEQVVLGAQRGNAPFLGVLLRTKDRRFDMPFNVSIDSGAIGGPSAGLAFTLALLDDLSPGELTGGHHVAVTGTIDLDGKVGPVGGVIQKTAAVRAAGANAFLVPSDEYRDARAHAGSHLRVYRVDTLDDALRVLGSLGGDVAALGPPPRGTRG